MWHERIENRVLTHIIIIALVVESVVGLYVRVAIACVLEHGGALGVCVRAVCIRAAVPVIPDSDIDRVLA